MKIRITQNQWELKQDRLIEDAIGQVNTMDLPEGLLAALEGAIHDWDGWDEETRKSFAESPSSHIDAEVVLLEDEWH